MLCALAVAPHPCGIECSTEKGEQGDNEEMDGVVLDEQRLQGKKLGSTPDGNDEEGMDEVYCHGKSAQLRVSSAPEGSKTAEEKEHTGR